jgi:large subunit ribosomal protein LP0
MNDSAILMGKNTLMKRCFRLYEERTGDSSWSSLLPELVGNVGIVFTNGDFIEVRDKIGEFKKGAPARVGLLAPLDVQVPAGPTGLGPEQTAFFQALNIPTKITKGTIEITTDVHLIKVGDRVGPSQATLLGKLGIKPFSYGLEIIHVYEGGSLFSPKVLDITDADLMASFGAGLRTVAAISMATGYPTIASIPHSIINGFKNVLAVSLETEYTFPHAQKVKDFLANPSAFAVAAPAGGESKASAAIAAPEPEPEPEEEEAMDFDLFD